MVATKTFVFVSGGPWASQRCFFSIRGGGRVYLQTYSNVSQCTLMHRNFVYPVALLGMSGGIPWLHKWVYDMELALIDCGALGNNLLC